MSDKTVKTDTTSITPSRVTITGSAAAADKTGKPTRLSKSARTYRRRLKQATHKPASAGG